MIAANSIVGGRYRVVRELGGGGMKLVYLAEDLRLAARPCALAEMVDSFTSADAQKQAIAAFQREADMLAQLSNEHIPRVFDRFSEANRHYLVMEYVDGVTLEDQLRSNGGKLAPARVVDIALQILDTLEYLHNLSPPVIYRDLKPSNVMVTAEGHGKLIDFGIARHFQPLSNATMIGTQGYAPPEQYRGRVETRSDLYALGATMHHALSGRDPAAEPPFSFPPLRKLCPDIEPKLAAAVDRALAYDVVNRMRDAAEFKRQLLESESGALSAPASTQPGAAPTNNSGARPQLRLPLGGPRARSAAQSNGPMSSARVPSSPAAPTVLSVSNEINCSNCARLIPADSRFCSYCAADLRKSAAGTASGVAHPDEETVVLSSPDSQPALPLPQIPRRAMSRDLRWMHREMRRRSGMRHPLLVLALIFAGAFLIVKLLILQSASNDTTPPGYDTGSNEPGTVTPPRARNRSEDARREPAPGGAPMPEPAAPDTAAPAPGLAQSVRLLALREALDAQGYTGVRFRMEGDTLIVWGTVRSVDDRAMVQLLCSTTAGIYSLRDQLTVADAADGG